jgi:hypothetical protein
MKENILRSSAVGVSFVDEEVSVVCDRICP